MRPILITAWPISLLLSVPVRAAESSAQLPQWAPLAGLLALGIGFVVLAIFLYLCFHALFLHLATQIVGLNQPFSTALRAWVVSILFQVLGGIALAFFAPFVHASLLLILLTMTLAVMVVYETGLLRALVSAALAIILTIAGTVALVLLLAALTVGLHRRVPHSPQLTPPPQRSGKTIDVRHEGARSWPAIGEG